MKYIEKVKLFNFKRFNNFVYSTREKRNILIGDNEAGKSTILQAIDLVLSGSRSRVENLGLESLFNQKVILDFLSGDKSLVSLPKMKVEVFLNDHSEIALDGRNNSDEKNCHGLKLYCEPMIDEYSFEIQQALTNNDALFPFEYYNIKFSTFADRSYSQNRKFINHLLIDNSLIGTEYAVRQYTKLLYEANTNIAERYQHNHAYRQSKASFSIDSLGELNNILGESKFEIKNDSKSNLENDLIITQAGIPITQMGKGKQCFIKTEFALQQREGSNPIDLILIEEPENHLSHLHMKNLLNEIEKTTKTQIIIATHSNNVCSRLDLHNASLISPMDNNPISLSDLPTDTSNYFLKAPNNKILEFVLSRKVLLVEGDAEYILLDEMYRNRYQQKLEDANIHLISVGGTAFKRYMDLAKLLKIKTAIVRDNDGNYQANCVDNYADYSMDNTQVFSDKNDVNRTTLEKCIYQDNQLLCQELFGESRRTLSVEQYMLSNKADAALRILEHGIERLTIPEYITRAFEWIRE